MTNPMMNPNPFKQQVQQILEKHLEEIAKVIKLAPNHSLEIVLAGQSYLNEGEAKVFWCITEQHKRVVEYHTFYIAQGNSQIG